MAETHQENPYLQSLFHALDPISLILTQNSNSDQLVPLKLSKENFMMKRGSHYDAYAELRESKLRMMNIMQQEYEEYESKLTPPRKIAKFQRNLSLNLERKGCSVLAQSVPDFSSALRKENRKPVIVTPPPASRNLATSNRSKSANGGEKKGGCGGFPARRTYAGINYRKRLPPAAEKVIIGENKGLRSGKNVFGYRQF